jgi:hypothetical protein
MHPKELIEVMIVGSVAVPVLIISLLLNGKWRKFGCLLALGIMVAYGTFYVARPFWIDAQINKKVEILKYHLEQRYPNEKWEIKTVPHREEGFKHLNPCNIGVIFENEPEVTYYYRVESKDNIYTTGTSEPAGYGYNHQLKHFEKQNGIK